METIRVSPDYVETPPSRRTVPLTWKTSLFFGLVAVFTVACSSPRKLPPSPATGLYYEGKTHTALLEQEKKLKALKPEKDGKNNIDWVWEGMRLSSCAQADGDYALAENTLLGCIRIIDSYSWDKRSANAGGLFGEEADAPFKGYPYERAMVSMYLGLIRYLRQDYDGALPSFRKVLNEDWLAEDKDAQSDWILAHTMIARCYYRFGDSGSAADSLKFARMFYADQYFKKNHPETLKQKPYLNKKALKDDNLVFVIEVGKSPVKSPLGKHRESVQIVRRPGPVARVTCRIDDGQPVEIPEIDSVYYQATTRGARQFDKILKGQVKFKKTTAAIANVAAQVAMLSDDRNVQAAAAAVWLVSAIFSASTRTEADTRHWDMLPDRLLYASRKVDPGVHVVTVMFYSKDGVELTNRRKTLIVDVPKPSKYDRLIWVRSLPNTAKTVRPDEPVTAILYGVTTGKKVFETR